MLAKLCMCVRVWLHWAIEKAQYLVLGSHRGKKRVSKTKHSMSMRFKLIDCLTVVNKRRLTSESSHPDPLPPPTPHTPAAVTAVAQGLFGVFLLGGVGE